MLMFFSLFNMFDGLMFMSVLMLCVVVCFIGFGIVKFRVFIVIELISSLFILCFMKLFVVLLVVSIVSMIRFSLINVLNFFKVFLWFMFLFVIKLNINVEVKVVLDVRFIVLILLGSIKIVVVV